MIPFKRTDKESNAWLLRSDKMSEEDKKFLKLLHNKTLRANLLERLERLGLLSSFLEVENETMKENASHNQ